MFGQTPVPGSALHRHQHCETTDHDRLPRSGLKALFELHKDRRKPRPRPPCMRLHVSVQYRWSGFAPWVSARSRWIKAHISAADFLCSIKKRSINSIPRLTVCMSASLWKTFPRINSSPRARTKIFGKAYILFAIRSTSTNYEFQEKRHGRTDLIQAIKGLNPALWRHRNIYVAGATRFFGDLPAQMQ